MEIVQLEDLNSGDTYSIYSYGHKYHNYTYLGIQLYRDHHIRYGFEKNDRKIFFWTRPWKCELMIYRKTAIRSTILYQIISSILHDESSSHTLCNGYF
jgi:hypothetical protein